MAILEFTLISKENVIFLDISIVCELTPSFLLYNWNLFWVLTF